MDPSESGNHAHWSSSSVDSMLDALNAITDKHARVNETKAIQAAILTDRKKIAVGATEAALHQHIEGGVER